MWASFFIYFFTFSHISSHNQFPRLLHFWFWFHIHHNYDTTQAGILLEPRDKSATQYPPLKDEFTQKKSKFIIEPHADEKSGHFLSFTAKQCSSEQLKQVRTYLTTSIKQLVHPLQTGCNANSFSLAAPVKTSFQIKLCNLVASVGLWS